MKLAFNWYVFLCGLVPVLTVAERGRTWVDLGEFFYSGSDPRRHLSAKFAPNVCHKVICQFVQAMRLGRPLHSSLQQEFYRMPVEKKRRVGKAIILPIVLLNDLRQQECGIEILPCQLLKRHICYTSNQKTKRSFPSISPLDLMGWLLEKRAVHLIIRKVIHCWCYPFFKNCQWTESSEAGGFLSLVGCALAPREQYCCESPKETPDRMFTGGFVPMSQGRHCANKEGSTKSRICSQFRTAAPSKRAKRSCTARILDGATYKYSRIASTKSMITGTSSGRISSSVRWAPILRN